MEGNRPRREPRQINRHWFAWRGLQFLIRAPSGIECRLIVYPELKSKPTLIIDRYIVQELSWERGDQEMSSRIAPFDRKRAITKGPDLYGSLNL
jgi:hypothetical protein